MSNFAFSQNKTDAKTIPELEFDMQKIIENGLVCKISFSVETEKEISNHKTASFWSILFLFEFKQVPKLNAYVLLTE